MFTRREILELEAQGWTTGRFSLRGACFAGRLHEWRSTKPA